MALDLGSIVDALGGELDGDPRQQVDGLAPLETAGPGQISFLSNPKYRPLLVQSQAACVIVSPAMQEVAKTRGASIVAADPYLYFARLTQLWRRNQAGGKTQVGIHPSAVVDDEAFVDPTAWIGPLCVVEKGARVGAGTVLKSRVTLGERCTVGERCILHAGVVIGADGFGFAPNAGAWEKIEQLGAVRIGNDVEIGANTCVDRGALADTVIEDGVKLDNLIQIAHNVRIGRHTAMAACVGIAGSTTIGAHCTVGGAAGIAGHLVIADHVHIGPASVVTHSLTKAGGAYGGFFPIDDNSKWEKNAVAVRRLVQMRERLRALENAVKQLSEKT